ncbi:MAG: hypothetical protein K2L11_04585 [Muribaculaceae bacterium]|nr:hypothetical protein [Muribaculaceae bacterium]
MTIYLWTAFPHGGLRPDGPHRAMSSTAAIIANNDENIEDNEDGSPSHRKSTMTSLLQPMAGALCPPRSLRANTAT